MHVCVCFYVRMYVLVFVSCIVQTSGICLMSSSHTDPFSTPQRSPWSTPRVQGKALWIPELPSGLSYTIAPDSMLHKRTRTKQPEDIDAEQIWSLLAKTYDRNKLMKCNFRGYIFGYDYADTDYKQDRKNLHDNQSIIVAALELNPQGVWKPLIIQEGIQLIEQRSGLKLTGAFDAREQASNFCRYFQDLRAAAGSMFDKFVKSKMSYVRG